MLKTGAACGATGAAVSTSISSISILPSETLMRSPVDWMAVLLVVAIFDTNGSRLNGRPGGCGHLVAVAQPRVKIRRRLFSVFNRSNSGPTRRRIAGLSRGHTRVGYLRCLQRIDTLPTVH